MRGAFCVKRGTMPDVLECTFFDLAEALVPVHLDQDHWVDKLHDVWISHGVWTPDSFNFNEAGERVVWDERQDQRDKGIFLKRIVPRPPFMQWWVDCTTAIGHQNNDAETAKIAYFALASELQKINRRRSS